MKISTAAANPANRRPSALTSSGCDEAISETYDHTGTPARVARAL